MSSSTPLHVLLVEDEPATQVMVREELSGAAIEVEAVATMFDAPELMAFDPSLYRCVIVDLGLPDVDGDDSVRAMVTATGAPVVVFSGSEDPGAHDRALDLGAVAFVGKDDGVGRLAQVITDAATGSAPKLVGVPAAARDVVVSADYQDVVSRTLRFLQSQVPMGAWLFTRVQGNDWIVLDAVGNDYDVAAGTVLRWSDSFCARMVEGQGPRVSLEPASVEAYRTAPAAQLLDIRTYIGVPLAIEHLGLFGTLCGISSEVLQTPLGTVEPFLTHLGEVLSSAVAMDLERDRLQRHLDLAKLASTSDSLCGLPNRRAFELMVRVEEARCRRYGSAAAIAMVDLDGLKQVNDTDGHAAGDRMIIKAARALTDAKRASDVAFRIGGDEFAVLATECDDAGVTALVSRLRHALEAADLHASIGAAVRRPQGTLDDAIVRADDAMYADKRRRKDLAGL